MRRIDDTLQPNVKPSKFFKIKYDISKLKSLKSSPISPKQSTTSVAHKSRKAEKDEAKLDDIVPKDDVAEDL